MEDLLKNTIETFSQEHNMRGGFVSCEMAIHRKDLAEFEKIAIKQNLEFGKWIVMKCQTCEEYHGEGYLHASIENFEYIPKMENSENHIKTI